MKATEALELNEALRKRAYDVMTDYGREQSDIENKALRLLDLIESGILEDSQCGDTGEYGYWIEPEHREKIKEILDD